jgi:beta-lactamase superfamily II metal-dependent hydrolase
MARRFVRKKTQPFYFLNEANQRKSYVLIYGDEVNTRTGTAPSGGNFKLVEYRGRLGEWTEPPLSTERMLELYFLDVGQGDAAFAVTPNGTRILVDGGLRERALGFLIWKYRLDIPANRVQIDHLFLSHADSDHVEGLIPLLNHPQIDVLNVYHNGIGVFDSGFAEDIGDRSPDGERLITLHDSLADLNGLQLASGSRDTFQRWIQAVTAQGSSYRALSAANGTLDVGDPAVALEVLGPRLEPDGQSLRWFDDKAHTINGNSLVFRLTHRFVRTFFSGDLNEEGGDHLLSFPNAALQFNSHIFKTPHHGSHEFSQHLFDAVKPMVSVVSSGNNPDHGHPRAVFLGGLGLSGRGTAPLVFATEIAATFVDAGDSEAVPTPATAPSDIGFGDLDFATSAANTEARRRFKQILPGVINVRTDGREIYAFRRVQASYQWESYGPLVAVD